MAAARANPALAWLAAGVSLLLAFFVVGIVARAVSPSPSGPALSSYATTTGGVAAWSELLSRDGHSVRQIRDAAARSRLPADATLVILSSGPGLPESETRSLQRFLDRGGRVVLGGGVSAAARELRGGVVTVDHPAFLENGALAKGDNAIRSLRLAGAPGRAVYFDETLHGYGAATGLAALPERWWLAFAGLGLALLAWSLSRAARVGGSDPRASESPSPRTAYIEAMGHTLMRSGSRAELVTELGEAAEREAAFRRSSMNSRPG